MGGLAGTPFGEARLTFVTGPPWETPFQITISAALQGRRSISIVRRRVFLRLIFLKAPPRLTCRIHWRVDENSKSATIVEPDALCGHEDMVAGMICSSRPIRLRWPIHSNCGCRFWIIRCGVCGLIAPGIQGQREADQTGVESSLCQSAPARNLEPQESWVSCALWRLVAKRPGGTGA